jgi:hypothetical protein
MRIRTASKNFGAGPAPDHAPGLDKRESSSPFFLYCARPRAPSGGNAVKEVAILKIILTTLTLAAMPSIALAEASRPTRFWNLTRHTISELALAPAGTTNFGPNQCKNDKDGTVDPDERLRITGIATGTYDAKLKDVSGRSCLVRNVKVEAGEIFSIEEKELTSCTRW